MSEFMDGYVTGQDSRDNNNGGTWGESWIWILVVFALLFGWGGNGGGIGGFARGGGSSGGGVTDGYVLASDFANIERKLDTVNGGLCDGFYAMNTGMLNGFAGVNSALASGFHGVDNAVCQLGYQNAQLINGLNTTMLQGFNGVQAGQTALGTQLQNCCCENRQATADLKYTMATDTCATNTAIATTGRDIIDSQNAGTRAILDALNRQAIEAKDTRIAELQAQVQSLNLAASQQAQNNYLIQQLKTPCPIPAYITCNPNAPYNYGGGCGCNG